jgi:hypothetical protein
VHHFNAQPQQFALAAAENRPVGVSAAQHHPPQIDRHFQHPRPVDFDVTAHLLAAAQLDILKVDKDGYLVVCVCDHRRHLLRSVTAPCSRRRGPRRPGALFFYRLALPL